MTRIIACLAYAGAQPLDLSGPLQAFATANDEAQNGTYQMRVFGQTAGAFPLEGGLTVLAAAPPRGAVDTLLIPGGPGVHKMRQDPLMLRLVGRLAGRARRTAAICTGAFLLAEAGLLEGRQAATHWRSCARLAAEFPGIRVAADPIWVRDGNIWTSAGVTAGIDLALALIEDDLGPQIAIRVARRLVVYMRRSGGQAQYSAPLALQADDSFAPLLAWAASRLHAALDADSLAARAGMAPRSFHRHFLLATGTTPAKAIERLRLDQARNLMETTRLSLLAIARQSGFGSEERLRRAFQRGFGVAPAEWRAHFGE